MTTHRFPDFLGIGAQKAGTSWLAKNLGRHPRIWMPPVKELHYFTDRAAAPVITRIHEPRYRHVPRSALGSLLIRGRRRQSPWYLRFLFLPRDDRWYAKLFRPGAEQLCGEVTPGYAVLEVDQVARIKALMPDLKVIYLLRNPVHRMWSQAAMYFAQRQGKRLDEIDGETLRTYLAGKARVRRSDYLAVLATWERYFAPDRIFVGFLDHIAENPQGALGEVLEFLDLPRLVGSVGDEATRKVEARSYPTIPDALATYLVDLHYDKFTGLHARFDNRYTADWLAFADRYRSR